MSQVQEEQEAQGSTASPIRRALDSILPLVQRPARYLGLERNLQRKSWSSARLHVALTFPDTYEIGMSHQGSQILYHLVNRREGSLAERSYAPWPDMASAMRSAGVPLYTLESYRAVKDFEVIGITLQSELNYINVPYVLELAEVPLYARSRGSEHPLVIGGGPCVCNPEPVADFFDAILIGDAEAGLDQMLDVLVAAQSEQVGRGTTLRWLAGVRGVYVPSLYKWQPASGSTPAAWESLDETAVIPVTRVWTDRLDPADAPAVPIVPFAEVVQDRVAIEIMRGCTQGCRFCQAGFWYRPVREQDPEIVIDRIERQTSATGLEEVGLMSLSTSDYSQVQPLVNELADRFSDRRVSLSLPSLRADSVSVGLADAVSRVRKASFTIAPEAGSERLRRVINKTLSDDDVLGAAEAAFSRGWNLIKLYAMIGLPTETDEDLKALADLTLKVSGLGRRIRGGKAQVKLSIGCFVPKPGTPFQWEPFVAPDELNRRLHLIRAELGRKRGVKLSWSNPEVNQLEALLARGDRSMSSVIERASCHGAALDGWSDQLNLEAWHKAFTELGVDLHELNAERPIDTALPWSIIDSGVRDGYLKAERRRALAGATTRDCKWGHCLSCGIPGDGADVVLATPHAALTVTNRGDAAGEPPPPTSPTPRAQRPTDAATRGTAGETRRERHPVSAQPPRYRRYRVSFCKLGDARFLSHRQVMDTLEKAMRGAGAPLRFTEGFNPHIRLSMGPALSTGHEGAAELLDVDSVAPLRQRHLEAVNRLLPEGLQLLEARDLLPGAPSLGKLAAATRYRIRRMPDRTWPESCAGLPDEIRDGIISWRLDEHQALLIELNIRPDDGPTPTLKVVLKALGLEDTEVSMARVRRELIRLHPRGRRHGSQP